MPLSAFTHTSKIEKTRRAHIQFSQEDTARTHHSSKLFPFPISLSVSVQPQPPHSICNAISAHEILCSCQLQRDKFLSETSLQKRETWVGVKILGRSGGERGEFSHLMFSQSQSSSPLAHTAALAPYLLLGAKNRRMPCCGLLLCIYVAHIYVQWHGHRGNSARRSPILHYPHSEFHTRAVFALDAVMDPARFFPINILRQQHKDYFWFGNISRKVGTTTTPHQSVVSNCRFKQFSMKNNTNYVFFNFVTLNKKFQIH